MMSATTFTFWRAFVTARTIVRAENAAMSISPAAIAVICGELPRNRIGSTV
jgi:hypothetical protein